MIIILNVYVHYLQANTDMLICVSDQSKSGHYYATGRTTPTMTTPVSIFFPAIIRQNEKYVGEG